LFLHHPKSLVLSFIDTARSRTFLHDYLTQTWKRGAKTVPYPLAKVLGGRVFKTLDVIKAFVIELFIKGLKGRGDLRKIDDPSGSGL